MMTVEKLKQIVTDEETGHVQLEELRQGARHIPLWISDVRVNSRDHAIKRGIETVQAVLSWFAETGVTYGNADAGHGLGHMVRDYVNALRLVTRLDADPRVIFPGFVAGVLHDCACTLVNRYDEQNSIVRHAGAAALVIDEIMHAGALDLTGCEFLLIEYGVAAHTHYLKPLVVTGKDGVRRSLEPYTDTAPDGSPYLSVWLPRWIDRLDCNGPSFAARHYLTLASAHEDFANGGTYPIEYCAHMRPLLRSNEEIKADGNRRTMIEHLQMFNDSQTNASPYGKHDFGAMVGLRDGLREQAARLLLVSYNAPVELTQDRQYQIQRAWTEFLAVNIEPHPTVGRPTAEKLDRMFSELSTETRYEWSRRFVVIMDEYCRWADQALADLDAMPREWMRFAHVDDVRDIIRPKRSWMAPLMR